MKTLKNFKYYLSQLLRSIRIVLLKAQGIQIGRNTMISMGAKIDTHRGRISIGNNCLITNGVKIVSHDGASRMIDLNDNGDGVVIIGNNVFIGVNSVILRNVKIGDNAIIGAGSVVNRDVPPCVVVAGNPAKIVKELTGPFPVLNDHKKG